jgi:hypothetical protein
MPVTFSRLRCWPLLAATVFAFRRSKLSLFHSPGSRARGKKENCDVFVYITTRSCWPALNFAGKMFNSNLSKASIFKLFSKFILTADSFCSESSKESHLTSVSLLVSLNHKKLFSDLFHLPRSPMEILSGILPSKGIETSSL